MTIENELDAYISGFHLDALSSGVPLNVDLDTTLTVVAGNLYRLLARNSPATRPRPPTHLAPLPRRRRHHPRHRQRVTCELNLRSYHPQLIDAGYADTKTPIPWWNNRTLQFTFPPR